MAQTHFRDIQVSTPTESGTAGTYQQIGSDWESAITTPQRLSVVRRWDDLRRQLETWEALTELRFQQDTRNETYKQARDYLDELRPKLIDLAVKFKRRLLSS